MRAARKVLHAIERLLDSVAVALLAAVLAVGSYALWDSNSVAEAASPSHWDVYRPVAGDTASYEELVAINPDVKAWLTVYGTNIDYPVCQSSDVRTYLTTDARGEHSMSGALFMEPGNSSNFSDFATIVYGHHMAGDVMFGQVTDFAQQEFFDTHRYGDLYAAGRHWGLEFMCYLATNAYDADTYRIDFAGTDDEQAYVARLLERATCKRATASADRVVLLSTCASGTTNGRGVLVARLTGQTYDNPFAEVVNTGTGADVRPAWLGASAGVAVALLLAAFAVAVWRRRRKDA